MPTAILSEREPAGGALTRIRLQIDEATAATHKHHAQYIEVRHDGGWRGDEDATIPAAIKGIFVIASAPREKTWDLLVKQGGAMADRLETLPLSMKVTVSEAQGRGFPYDAAKGNPLVLAVTGSGIAAVLSTIGSRISDGEARRTFVLYGVREKKDVAVSAEIEAMRAAGVHVAICLSREHLDEEGFFKGYVQHVAQERRWRLEGGRVFAAGNKAMVEGVRDAMPSLGLKAEDVVLNF
jgi:NAD(P)H-flavin reductase